MKVKPEQGHTEGVGAGGAGGQLQPCENMSLNPWNGDWCSW